MRDTLRAAKFLVTGPLILTLLLVINLMTSPGHWWIQWPALGMGIAWVISLLRVLRAVLLLGGLAAAWAWYQRGAASAPTRGPDQRSKAPILGA